MDYFSNTDENSTSLNDFDRILESSIQLALCHFIIFDRRETGSQPRSMKIHGMLCSTLRRNIVLAIDYETEVFTKRTKTIVELDRSER